jgi:phosphoserine phosphatase
MNLVISGTIDDTLRNLVVRIAKPHAIVRLHAGAYRLEEADDSEPTRVQVKTLCDSARVDHAYIEAGVRFSDFKLLALDMDSTLITIECIDEIADFAGKKKEVAAITEAAMRGEIADFGESLRRRVALLNGTPASVLEQVFDERLRLSRGAEQLIAAARESGLYIVLLSGGFTYFTERLKDMLSLDAAYGNSPEIIDGLLTGNVEFPILDSKEKANHLENTMHFIGATAEQSIAIGDGANDAKMLSKVKLSIAYHAKPALQKVALAQINFGGLDVVQDYCAY